MIVDLTVSRNFITEAWTKQIGTEDYGTWVKRVLFRKSGPDMVIKRPLQLVRRVRSRSQNVGVIWLIVDLNLK